MRDFIKYLFIIFLFQVGLNSNLNVAKAQSVCNVDSASGNDTSKIQSAIDSCAGGGKMRLISGPTTTPTSRPSTLGDIDGDGDVDIFDYNILAENFGQ